MTFAKKRANIIYEKLFGLVEMFGRDYKTSAAAGYFFALCVLVLVIACKRGSTLTSFSRLHATKRQGHEDDAGFAEKMRQIILESLPSCFCRRAVDFGSSYSVKYISEAAAAKQAAALGKEKSNERKISTKKKEKKTRTAERALLTLYFVSCAVFSAVLRSVDDGECSRQHRDSQCGLRAGKKIEDFSLFAYRQSEVKESEAEFESWQKLN